MYHKQIDVDVAARLINLLKPFKGALRSFGDDILIRRWLITLFLNKLNKQTLFVFITE